jgi:hypothetical protein
MELLMANPLVELQERAALGDPEAAAALQRFNAFGRGGTVQQPMPQGDMTQSQFGNPANKPIVAPPMAPAVAPQPKPPTWDRRMAMKFIEMIRGK